MEYLILVSEKFNILSELRLVDWFESDKDYARIIINSIASFYFGDKTFDDLFSP